MTQPDKELQAVHGHGRPRRRRARQAGWALQYRRQWFGKPPEYLAPEGAATTAPLQPRRRPHQCKLP
eukprot:5627743-Prorocentrum_lima.AAC.1